LIGSFVAGAIILVMIGSNPGLVYQTIFSEAWFTEFGLRKTLVETTPFLIVAAGLVVCFRAGIWNVGVPGQMIIGGLLSNVVGYSLGPLPSPILIPLMLAAGMVAGMAWVLLPAVMKARWGLNEIVTTLMMNFIAIDLQLYLVKSPLRDPYISTHPMTTPVVRTAELPDIPGTEVHIGLIIAFALAIVVYFLMSRTTYGYQFKVIGSNLKAARYAGLPIGKLIILSLLISGAAAGLAGGVQVAGVMRNIDPEWMPSYGLEAVPLVFLANLNALAAIPFSFLFSTFLVGGDQMHRAMGIPIFFIDVILGLMLLFFAAGESVKRVKLGIRSDRE
jgi:simple sugar transport system permease protein